MRDISKKLTVINTGTKESEAGAASQPSGVVYVGAGGGGGGGNMNDYLLKSIWNKVWEIRTDSQGTEYIYGKLPVVLQYGLTMYSGEGVDIPSIYEGLPIDNDTIYWKDGILKAKAGTEGAITEITSSMVTSALGYTPYDASNPNGYITSAALANYALSSDVAAVSTKLNDFLEGSDTDNIINKWKELEVFLTGLSQSDNLATILGNKAEKTDLAKYIPIAGATDITGEKNFIGGLKVNGSPIVYDSTNKYWKLEGDLLVTGGVTMYGNDSNFVPSTIMDAILYDDSTLGINANGELYVKGGTGGISGDYLPLSGGTISNSAYGPLTIHRANGAYGAAIRFSNNNDGQIGLIGINGSGNASNQRQVFFEDYLGVQHTIWHSGNLIPSNYLPLSGGTIESEKNLPLTIKRNNAYGVGISFANNNETISIQAYNGVLSRIDNNNNSYTIWDSGNDGSGSGLDADLLDGLDAMAFFCDKGASNSFDDKIYNGAYRTSSFKPNNAYGYGLVASFRSMETCAQIYFPDNNGEPQFRMQWNSQTGISHGWTGLVTAASIGNYNAGSATRIQAYTHDSGDKVLLSGTRSDNTYERYIYDNGWGLMLKRGLTNTSGYIATLNDNVASATKSTYSRYIGNVGRDGTTWYDTEYPIYFQWGGSDGNSLYIKCSNYPIVCTQATKLEIARTIWGQSFDGTRDVSGDIYTSSHRLLGTYGGAFLYAGIRDGEALSIEPLDSDATWLNRGITLLKNGNVGIGTATPSCKLDIVSYCRSEFMYFYNKDYNGNAGYIGRASNGNNRIILYAGSDDVYIYSKGVISTIFTGANMLVQGGVTMYSDERKKTILNHVELSLKQIAEAPLIEHYYNSDQNKTTHVGSIAQYWAEMNDWFCKKDSEGFYTMEIQNAALASAISVARELVKFETETDRRIRLLEEENKRLKEEVEQLKWNIA